MCRSASRRPCTAARSSWPRACTWRAPPTAWPAMTGWVAWVAPGKASPLRAASPCPRPRSEEHTSELQSPCNLVCRLLLEKKNIGARRTRQPPQPLPCRADQDDVPERQQHRTARPHDTALHAHLARDLPPTTRRAIHAILS